LILRGGAGLSRQTIQDEFDKLKAAVRVSGGVGYVYAGISTTKANLNATLTLLATLLQNPDFDEKEFEQYKKHAKSRY